MTEPRTNRVDVNTGAQQVRRGGVADRVRTDPLSRHGCNLLDGRDDVTSHKGMNTKTCKRLVPLIDEQFFALFTVPS